MTKKVPNINIRGDEYYDQILNALVEKMGKKNLKLCMLHSNI